MIVIASSTGLAIATHAAVPFPSCKIAVPKAASLTPGEEDRSIFLWPAI